MSIDIAPYESLLRTERIRGSTQGQRATVVQTGSDRGRIVFSSAFRRLQQKAQVFPLDSNAAVRTRLTHSLEVAHTGRYLAQEILYRIRESVGEAYANSWLSAHEQVFTDIVEAACLIHDIGNPPFGHFGEAAIRDWFSDKGRVLFCEFARKNRIKESAIDRYFANEYLDFLAFDGNPQGLRLVTKLQGDDGATGLNLTFPLLMAYLKYNCVPTDSKLVNPSGRAKKPGYFSTEQEIIRQAAKALSMDPEARHPLSYVMEAADDISYCMSDIEDGIEKNVVSEQQLFENVSAAWAHLAKENPHIDADFASDLVSKATQVKVISPFIVFKTSIINLAVKHAAEVYCDGHDDIIAGRHAGLIRNGSEIVMLLELIKDFVRRTVFRSADAESVELAGYSTIKGLLNHFCDLLLLPQESFQDLIKGHRVDDEDYALRLINRLSEKSRAAYNHSTQDTLNLEQEWHLRAHLLVDHISGMTDHFAVRTFQLLAGIKIIV